MGFEPVKDSDFSFSSVKEDDFEPVKKSDFAKKKNFGQKFQDWTAPNEPGQFGEQHPNLYAAKETLKDINFEVPRIFQGVISGGLDAARSVSEGYNMLAAGAGAASADVQQQNVPWYKKDVATPFYQGAMEEKQRLAQLKQKGPQEGQGLIEKAQAVNFGNYAPIGGESALFKKMTEGVEGGKGYLGERAEKADMNTLGGQIQAAVDHGLIAGIDYVMDRGMLKGLTHTGKQFIKAMPKVIEASPKVAAQAYEAAKKAPQAVKQAVGKFNDMRKNAPEEVQRQNNKIEKLVESVFKPEKGTKTFAGTRNQNIDSGVSVANDIHKATLEDGITFADKDGIETSGRAPENRLENLHVAEQRMPEIWDRVVTAIDSVAPGMSFSLAPLIADLTAKTNSWDGRAATQKWADAARQVISDLQAQEDGPRKGVQIKDVIEELKAWGEKRPSMFNPNDAVTGQVIDPIIKFIQDEADKAIEQAVGPENNSQFLQDRKLYSDYRKYIKNITADATKYQKDAAKYGINQFDIIASIGGLGSLLSLSPKGMVVSAGMEGLNMWRKHVNSPDRPVKQLYNAISERNRQDARIPKSPEEPKAGPGVPVDDQNWGAGAVDPLRNAPQDLRTDRMLPIVRPVTERGFQRAGIDYPIEGEVVEPQQAQRQQAPRQAPIDAAWEDMNKPKQIEHQIDPREIKDHAWNKWQEAEERGDVGAANWWMKKYEEAVRYEDHLSKEQTLANKIKSEGSTLLSDVTGGIVTSLMDAIKKEGGGAKGMGKVALKYGVPAGLLAAYLKADDEGRKKLFDKHSRLRKIVERL